MILVIMVGVLVNVWELIVYVGDVNLDLCQDSGVEVIVDVYVFVLIGGLGWFLIMVVVVNGNLVMVMGYDVVFQVVDVDQINWGNVIGLVCVNVGGGGEMINVMVFVNGNNVCIENQEVYVYLQGQ